MEDRRHSQRVPATPLVRVVHRPSKDSAATMHDVSVGGFSMELPHDMSFEVGDEVVVHFPLGRSQSGIRTKCVVRAIDPGDIRLARLAFLDSTEIFCQTVEASINAWKVWEE